MTKVNHIKFATLFVITVLLTTSLVVQSAPSAFAKPSPVTGPSDRVCGDRLCDAKSGDDAEKEREQMRQQIKSGTAPEEEPEVPEEKMAAPETPKMEEKMEEKTEKKD